MSPARWRIAAASVTGTAHARQGLPCQDAAVSRVLREADGSDVLLTVVSDGAGSAPRAETGSLIACSTLDHAVALYLDAGGRVDAIDVGVARGWLGQLQSAIASRAREECRAPRDYACTLLAAVVGGDTLVTMQIGDGAIVVSEGEGWRWAHWPQRGEFANTTFFATDECARDRMAFASARARIVECAAFSDGIEPLVIRYASRTVFEPFFDQMFLPVRALEEEGVSEPLSLALAGYLDSPLLSSRTDDDKTLVMATRRERPRPAPALRDPRMVAGGEAE